MECGWRHSRRCADRHLSIIAVVVEWQDPGRQRHRPPSADATSTWQSLARIICDRAGAWGTIGVPRCWHHAAIATSAIYMAIGRRWIAGWHWYGGGAWMYQWARRMRTRVVFDAIVDCRPDLSDRWNPDCNDDCGADIMKIYLTSLVSGIIFGLGLTISGMTDPVRVLGFLNLAGQWDATLLFVLGGAVCTTALTFRFILKRSAPVLATQFDFPVVRKPDLALVSGAILFGLGWGLSGYCPGPAIALLANPSVETWVFIPALLVGLLVGNRLIARSAVKP